VPLPAKIVIDMKNTFTKEERLCSRGLIDKLFHDGSSFVLYPFRVVLLTVDHELPTGVQVILSVSKRKFKHAYMRNRIKRKMREAYRLQKGDILYPAIRLKAINLLLAIQYVAHEDLSFDQYQLKMNKVLNQIVHEVA